MWGGGGGCVCGCVHAGGGILPLILCFVVLHRQKNYEPAKHIKPNEGHVFTFVCKTPKYKMKGRMLEAIFIKLKSFII